MKYPIDIRKAIYASVVPVKCDTERGTAFFIAPNTLVTARHIVAQNAVNGVPVIISTDKQVLCDVEYIAEEGVNVDVVLLRCKDYQQEDHLKLLAAEFNEDRQLTIVGYPKEFGNCSDIISMEVQDRLGNRKEDYDTTVVRTDSLAFTSYKGFSGSPVLNEKGSVIGITVNQLGGSLGYASIKSLATRFENHNVVVSKDWQSEDFSPCGRGTSQRQVEKAVGYAALRYNRNLHVGNSGFDEEVNMFALRQYRLYKEKDIKEIEYKAIKSFGKELVKYRKGDYDMLFTKLRIWRNNNPNSERWSPDIKDFYRDEYPKLQLLIDKWRLGKNQIVLAKGKAGMGKTHYVCATAERLCKEMNVYLLFGSRFSEDQDFESQLCSMMGIGENALQKLNGKMMEENSNALIIIDALNEGATENFWNVAMKRMETLLKLYDRLKLLITYRDDEEFDLSIPCSIIELRGFEDNTQEAIQKYFAHYQIDDTDGNIQKRYFAEFSEPLFLTMFCIVASHDLRYMMDDFTYSDLFHQYIKYRNDMVSKGVDEDSHRNVTENALMKFAKYSLYYNQCSDISRLKARHYADQICRNRTWSNNLLNWILKENLMLSTGQQGERLMFGYQKMGDFLMADIFMHNKMTDEAKVDFILEKGTRREYASYRRFIIALLSEWELTPQLLERKIATKMHHLILASLRYHGKNNQAILKWMQNNNIFSVRILHDFLQDLTLEVFMVAHHVLKSADMAHRDKTWSTMVNQEYSHRLDAQRFAAFIDIIPREDTDEGWSKIVILLCWMCSSPHPYVRGAIIRKLVEIFGKKLQMVLFALNEFFDCNDPYVVQVITCAIYGHLLRMRDAKEASEIANMILQFLYQNNKAPEDILVRQWSIQALALADELNGTNVHLGAIRPPFSSENPYDRIIDKAENITNTYFGESKGSWKMYETLYGFSDFRRYIIGTNSRSESDVFLKRENDSIQGVFLSDIQLMVANIAKHDFHWNDELGKLDDYVFSEGRYYNLTERFGKKYLWLALYKVDALLSDHFKVADGCNYLYSPTENDIEPTPYPWYTREYSRIDPTILNASDAQAYISFQADELEDIQSETNEQWMSKEHQIPQPRLMVKDTDGSEWIVLTCYDGYRLDAEEGTVKDLFLFSNAAFIKYKELEIFGRWAAKQNFHGRWMPERRNGSIDYLWNEYPWADTYKRTLRDVDDWEYPGKSATFTINLSYEAQLQEEWIGLDETKMSLKEVSMPNHLVMKALNLYTAERGVVRDKSNNAIAARNFSIGIMNGLAMRKEYLDQYLSDNNLALVFYSLGEKYIIQKGTYQSIGHRYDLSGAYCYHNHSFDEIQPMHISNTL
ncbi:trypsin-like peptidase domain-containing protein [Segatella copri]|uniref:trypsin-like peptidase domain-containing protein n=1 Tax=Segatella copri TaxID=165179 RepID=UPI003F8BBF9D